MQYVIAEDIKMFSLENKRKFLCPVYNIKNQFSYFSNKTYVVGLNETFSFSTQAFSWECVPEKWFSYSSTKTCVVGSQQNRLNETVLLSTQNIC